MCGSNLYLIRSNRGTAGAPDTVRSATHAHYNSKISSTCNFHNSAVISFFRPPPSKSNCNHAECSALYRVCQDNHIRPIEGEFHSVVHTLTGLNFTCHLIILALRLLISYIYGAPSKARNANVVYIWNYVWQR